MPQQPLRTAARKHGFQRLQQAAVLAAQIHQALAGPHHQRRDGHSLKDGVSIAAEQGAVFKSAGLALIGIANHVMRLTRKIAAQLPLGAGGKARAAPAAQFGAFDVIERALRAAGDRLGQCLARSRLGAQQDVGAADLVVPVKPFGRPIRHRGLVFNQCGHVRNTRRRQTRNHLVVVDQRRRALVAHTGAGRCGDAHPAIRTHGIGRDAQAHAQVLHQRLTAQHAVGDVVAEQYPVLAYGLRMEKAVKAGHAFHVSQRKAQPIGHRFQAAAGKPVLVSLQLAQHLHQPMGRVVMPVQQRINIVDGMAHGTSTPLCLKW